MGLSQGILRLAYSSYTYKKSTRHCYQHIVYFQLSSFIQILYGETPANPTMSILDVAGFAALGKAHPQLVTMIDATFASPYLLQPLKYGVDLVMHSW